MSLEIPCHRFPFAQETVHVRTPPAHPGQVPVQAHRRPPPPSLEGRPYRRPGPAVPLHVGLCLPGAAVQGLGSVQGGGFGGGDGIGVQCGGGPGGAAVF